MTANIYTRTIDTDDAIRLLAMVVEKFGTDHVASQGNPTGGGGACYLGTTDETGLSNNGGVDPLYLLPVCIVGQAFSLLGIHAALMDGNAGQYGTCLAGEGMWDNAEIMGVTFTEDAREVMRVAQAAQDEGESWGTALRYALREAERLMMVEVPKGIARARSLVG
jgi:hypothetical protein